jgi:hypothetical protein
MAKRYFTLAEANALVPQLTQSIHSLQELKREISQKHRRLLAEKQMRPAEPDTFFAQEAELEFLLFNAQSILKGIADLGAELKDIDLGLVDFPTWIDGQEALLCWHLGESEIRYWHGLYEGFQGRKPISFE